MTSYRIPQKKSSNLFLSSHGDLFSHLFVGVDIHLPTKITPSPWRLGACSSEIYPLCKIWKTHQSIIFPGKSWAPHGFPLVFQSMLGNLARFSAFLMGNLAISCHILKVRHIQATIGAFAAILKNGRVVTWDIPAVVGTSAASKIRFETYRTWSHWEFNGSGLGGSR